MRERLRKESELMVRALRSPTRKTALDTLREEGEDVDRDDF